MLSLLDSQHSLCPLPLVPLTASAVKLRCNCRTTLCVRIFPPEYKCLALEVNLVSKAKPEQDSSLQFKSVQAELFQDHVFSRKVYLGLLGSKANASKTIRVFGH